MSEKIYVVDDSDYDPGTLIAAFHDEEAALEFIDEMETEGYRWFSKHGPSVVEIPLYKDDVIQAVSDSLGE